MVQHTDTAYIRDINNILHTVTIESGRKEMNKENGGVKIENIRIEMKQRIDFNS